MELDPAVYLALNSNSDPTMELSVSQLKSRPCSGIIWLSTQIQTLQWNYLALNSNPDPAVGIIWLSTQIQTLQWNYLVLNSNSDPAVELFGSQLKFRPCSRIGCLLKRGLFTCCLLQLSGITLLLILTPYFISAVCILL